MACLQTVLVLSILSILFTTSNEVVIVKIRNEVINLNDTNQIMFSDADYLWFSEALGNNATYIYTANYKRADGSLIVGSNTTISIEYLTGYTMSYRCGAQSGAFQCTRMKVNDSCNSVSYWNIINSNTFLSIGEISIQICSAFQTQIFTFPDLLVTTAKTNDYSHKLFTKPVTFTASNPSPSFQTITQNNTRTSEFTSTSPTDNTEINNVSSFSSSGIENQTSVSLSLTSMLTTGFTIGGNIQSANGAVTSLVIGVSVGAGLLIIAIIVGILFVKSRLIQSKRSVVQTTEELEGIHFDNRDKPSDVNKQIKLENNFPAFKRDLKINEKIEHESSAYPHYLKFNSLLMNRKTDNSGEKKNDSNLEIAISQLQSIPQASDGSCPLSYYASDSASENSDKRRDSINHGYTSYKVCEQDICGDTETKRLEHDILYSKLGENKKHLENPYSILPNIGKDFQVKNKADSIV